MYINQLLVFTENYFPELNFKFFGEILEIDDSDLDKIKLKVFLDMDVFMQNKHIFPEQEIEVEYDETKIRLC